MRSDPHDDPSPVDDLVAPPRRRWLGAVVAVVGLIGLAALAWYLTHRPAAPPGGPFAAMAAARPPPAPRRPTPRGPGGPGGGGRGGRGGASTVGVATATQRRHPGRARRARHRRRRSTTVTVRPQVSGVLTAGALHRRADGEEGRSCWRRIDPRPFEMALQQAIGARMRDEAQLENGARHAAALPHAARPGLDRAPGRRHAGGAGQAARGHASSSTAPTRARRGSTSATRRIVAPIAGRVGLRTVDVGNYVGAGDATGVAVITQLDADRRRVLGAAGPRARDPGERRPRARRCAVDRAATAPAPRKLDAGIFSTLDNQIDTRPAPCRPRRASPTRRRAVPEPVRQRAAAAAHDRRRGRRAGDGAAHGPSGDFVYVLNDDRTVSLRPVQRGEATVEVVAITSGLEVGERVVTEGGDRLQRRRARAAAGRRGRRAARRGASGGRSAARRGASARGRRAAAAAAAAAPRAAEPRRRARRRDEPVASLHPAAGRDLAADGGDRAGRPGRLPLPAAVGAAAGRLSDHPGADALPGRQPRGDGQHRDRAAGAPVRPDGRASSA